MLALRGANVKRIEIYEREDGRRPFSEWIESIDETVQMKILAFIDRVALGGSKKNVRPVGKGVFEIKINYGPGYRVYFGELENIIILLLLGGDKHTQKKDIRLAQKYWSFLNV